MTDFTNELAYSAAITSINFQNRCELQFVIAAISVTTETVTATTNAVTASGSNTLHFASQPPTIVVGWSVSDTTTPSAIPAGTTLLTASATPTMSANAAGVGVGASDIITFAPPFHVQRLALAGQILARQFEPLQLALWVMQNTTIKSEVVTDAGNAVAIGTSILDSDIAFQVNSIFTGLAISLPTTALSTI